VSYSILPIAALVGLAAGTMLIGAYQVLLSLMAREHVIGRARNIGTDRDVSSDSLLRQNLLVRWADRYDRSAAAQASRACLHQAYLPWRPSTWLLLRLVMWVGITMVGWRVVFGHLLPASILGGVAFILAPRVLLNIRQDAYTHAFDNQLSEVAQLLANGLRAGLSIRQALGRLAERVEEPARSEFGRTYRELSLGDDLPKVLTALRQRVRSQTLPLMIDAILIHHQAGGNLARILTGIADVLTTRQQLQVSVNAAVRNIRQTLLGISIISIIILVLLRNTPIFNTVFDTTLAWLMVGAYFVVQMILWYVATYVVRIKM
jgi:tight adherence protein B